METVRYGLSCEGFVWGLFVLVLRGCGRHLFPRGNSYCNQQGSAVGVWFLRGGKGVGGVGVGFGGEQSI